MLALISVTAALTASFGWASGVVLAQKPARMLGAFEFTRIQLISCAVLMTGISWIFGLWQSVPWHHANAYLVSVVFGIVLGNLAMVECLRLGGPRLTELLLCLKAPIVAAIAYLWLGETMTMPDIWGAGLIVSGLVLAISTRPEATADPEIEASRLTVVVFLGFAAAAFQGIGFLSVKPALAEGAEPLAVSAIRLGGAAAIVALIGLWPAKTFEPDAPTTPYLLLRTVLPGVIGYCVSSSLLLYAFAHLEAGVAAVLGSLSPLFVLPILWVVRGRRPDLQSTAGALCAVAGIAVIALY